MSRFCVVSLAFLQATVFSSTTLMADTGNEVVRDNDGNRYPTIKIGTQTWLAENLRSPRYSDSVSINRRLWRRFCRCENLWQVVHLVGCIEKSRS